MSHHACILLFKTDKATRADAENFLDEYKDDVWDWWVIGGRWSGALLGLEGAAEDDDSLNIRPLSEVLDFVKSWHTDPASEALRLVNKAMEHGQSDYNRGYCLRHAADAYQQCFSWATSVYNTEDYSWSLPEDPTGWWAILVDMHN